MQLYSQEVVKKWMKRLPDEIVMLTIMEQYSLSYQEYMDLPAYIVEVMIEKNNIDYKNSELSKK